MKKRLLCLTTAVILACSMAGCGDVKDDSSAVDSTAAAAVKTESVETPPELPEIEPVPVPEGGWTDETINDVTYINGKKINFPCKFKDLGEGFEIFPDDIELNKEKKTALVSVSYYGEIIASCKLRDCEDTNNLEEKELIYICFEPALAAEYSSDVPDKWPINVNGVSIGSSFEDVENNFGLELGTFDDYNAISRSIGEENLKIMFTLDINNGVDRMYVYDNMEKE